MTRCSTRELNPDRRDRLARLLRAAREGNRDAFGELIELLHEPMAGLAWMLTHHHADADDLLQETWVRVFTRLEQIKDPVALQGWLYRVMCTTASNLRHAEGRRHQRERTIRLFHDAQTGQYQDSELTAALEKLVPADRAILLLSVTHGHSYETIADLFGISEAAARQRVVRARASIRALLADTQDSS